MDGIDCSSLTLLFIETSSRCVPLDGREKPYRKKGVDPWREGAGPRREIVCIPYGNEQEHLKGA